MELKEYFQIFKREKKIIKIVVLFVFILTLSFSLLRGEFYQNDMFLLISRDGSQNTENYKYDGYYAAKASDIFADNVSQWLSSAYITNEVYRRAKIGSETKSLRGLSRIFKADKLSSQYVRVRYNTKDTETAKKLAHTMVDVLQEKAKELSLSSSNQISFKVIYSDPLSVKNESNLFLNGILAIVGGLFLGMFAALGKNYFKS